MNTPERGLATRRKTAVEVEQLVREFKGGIRAVDGVDLEVARGRDLRLPRPERRRQDDDGADPHDAAAPDRRAARGSPATTSSSEADAVRRAIGVALQEAAIDPLMTGRELLRMQGALHGLRARARRATAPTSCSSASGSSRPPTAASAATRAACAAGSTSRSRSSTARTCCSSTSRRPAWTRPAAPRCGARCARCNDEGTTVFLTTQYLEEAEQLADRVGIIDARQDRRRGNAGRAQGARRGADAARRARRPAGRARSARGARRRSAPSSSDRGRRRAVALRRAAGKRARSRR